MSSPNSLNTRRLRGRCDVVTDIARQYPIPIICALLGAPAEDWELFSDWTDDIFKAFSWNVADEADSILGHGRPSTTTSTIWSLTDATR